MPTVSGRDATELFEALSAELARRGSARTEICVIGGTALNMIGVVERPTRDIDIVALAHTDHSGIIRIGDSRLLPEVLVESARAVAREFGIEEDWLNSGPTSLLDAGMPEGFAGRLETREYGTVLAVHFAGRLDQICLKTYAAADVSGRHLTDLLALNPVRDELDFAFRWTMSQDASAAFLVQLAELAHYLEVSDVLDRITG